MKELIVAKNIKAGYQEDDLIINGVSSSFYENQIKAFMGYSGSGKTTLMKAFVGLVRVYSGEVRIFNKDFFSLKSDEETEVLKDMGFMFQNGALLGSYKVWENVALPLSIHTQMPLRVIKKIALQKLEMVGLKDAAFKYPNEMSGGMLKRASLARALIMDPKILMCDEPTAGLDPVNAKKLDDLILKLKQMMNLSILLVSHELDSILRIADSVLFLHHGKKEFDGSLEQAKNSDLEVVKSFFDKQ